MYIPEDCFGFVMNDRSRIVFVIVEFIEEANVGWIPTRIVLRAGIVYSIAFRGIGVAIHSLIGSDKYLY